MLESPTWRANPDWGDLLGYSPHALALANASAIALLVGLRERYAATVTDVIVSGMIGPRGDGYRPGHRMEPAAAAMYHRPQVEALAQAGADMVTAYTLTDTGEAIGIVQAARDVGLPVAVSFTVETDGRLASGATLAQAVVDVDAAAAPEYFLINCAHPTHVEPALTTPEAGANASSAPDATPPPRAMPSWTTPPNSTTATPSSWPPHTSGSPHCYQDCPSSVAAAGPTPATSQACGTSTTRALQGHMSGSGAGSVTAGKAARPGPSWWLLAVPRMTNSSAVEQSCRRRRYRRRSDLWLPRRRALPRLARVRRSGSRAGPPRRRGLLGAGPPQTSRPADSGRGTRRSIGRVWGHALAARAATVAGVGARGPDRDP